MRMTLFLIFCLVIILALGINYLGGFKKITFAKTMGPDAVLVFQKMTGSYKNAATKMDEIFTWLKEQGINTTKGFGLYFDNPRNVKEKLLRSVVGCILEKKDHDKIERISKKFHVKHMPATESVTTIFPFKTKLSVVMGVMRVYPAMAAYLRNNRILEGPVMEVYDVPNERIEYHVFPGMESSLLLEYFQAY